MPIYVIGLSLRLSSAKRRFRHLDPRQVDRGGLAFAPLAVTELKFSVEDLLMWNPMFKIEQHQPTRPRRLIAS
jgi:hypothetical protein